MSKKPKYQPVAASTTVVDNPETKRYYLDLNNKARIEKIHHAGCALNALAEILKATGEDQYSNAGDVAGFIAGELLNTIDDYQHPDLEVAP